MDHKGTKWLETKRLILRQFEITDAEAMYHNWASSEEVTRYLMWSPHKSVEVSREYIKSMREGYEKNDTYDWAIVKKESNEVIGSMGVVHIEERVGVMHVGYCIGEAWWHKGYTSEAFAEVIRYLFEEVGVNRIESRHDTKNPNSGKVMLKCGLKFEGTLRQSDWNNQGICDANWYALLKEEYGK